MRWSTCDSDADCLTALPDPRLTSTPTSTRSKRCSTPPQRHLGPRCSSSATSSATAAAPNAVIDRIRALNPVAIIRGNHDKAACGIEDGSNFNHVARVAALWTRRGADRREPRVSPGAARRAGEPSTSASRSVTARRSTRTTTSSTPRMRVRALDAGERPLCLFGHTHLPVVFQDGRIFDGYVPEPDEETTRSRCRPARAT